MDNVHSKRFGTRNTRGALYFAYRRSRLQYTDCLEGGRGRTWHILLLLLLYSRYFTLYVLQKETMTYDRRGAMLMSVVERKAL